MCRRLITMVVAIGLLGGVALAEADEWIRDDRTGCSVWNPHPQPNENIMWWGECLGGKASNRGVLQWMENGWPTSRYEGNMENGKEHGRGIYIWPNGDSYEGEFKAGEFHGQGIETLADGTRYEGEFKNGKRHGQGVKTSADGTRYEGRFKAGEFHGQGIETITDVTILRTWNGKHVQ